MLVTEQQPTAGSVGPRVSGNGGLATQDTIGGHRQRLKERFLSGEEAGQTDVSLLELLLCYAIPQKDVRPLAERLLCEFGSLRAVLAAAPDDLCRVSGIGTNTSVLLKLVGRLGQVSLDESRSGYRGRSSLQPTLFGSPAPDTHASTGEPGREDGTTLTEVAPVLKDELPHVRRVIPRRGTELFAKAALKEAIAALPQLPDTESLDAISAYLRQRLPYSAEQTRSRNAEYIIRRMFPLGYADTALRRFARRYASTQALRDACFYRFLKAEPFMVRVAESLLLPNIGSGHLSRRELADFVAVCYPSIKRHRDYGLSITDALTAGGVVKADRLRLTFGYRDIPLAAFAFVLQSEFDQPGIYAISKLEASSAIRALLWNPDQLLPALYELRNLGLIAKVSEIDSIRQFAIRWNIEEVVERLEQAGC